MKQILVNDKNLYNYNKDSNAYKLYYSNDTEWASPNELCMEIIDTGDGLTIATSDDNTICLDYHIAEEILILLKIINKKQKYEIISKKEKL